MQIIYDLDNLRHVYTTMDRDAIGFVPTMGNLHQGHLSLVAASKKTAQHTVVSIFVNPLQFGPHEDFLNYPRTLDADIEGLKSLNPDIVFVPDTAMLYPQGDQHSTTVIEPMLSQVLCGQSRPDHFKGVTTVVCKLFNIIRPRWAYFGEKDYQQFAIIKKMVADLMMPIEVLPLPTFRESNGLALSSRNAYLSSAQKELAPRLYQILQQCREKILAASQPFRPLEQAAMTELKNYGFAPDYFSIRETDTLAEAKNHNSPLRIFVAAGLGKCRLIDNIAV